jgi:hypothetical protein
MPIPTQCLRCGVFITDGCTRCPPEQPAEPQYLELTQDEKEKRGWPYTGVPVSRTERRRGTRRGGW